jgi:hypothetical protein
MKIKVYRDIRELWKNCICCPHFHEAWYGYYCDHYEHGHTVKGMDEYPRQFPDWCPLPDKQQVSIEQKWKDKVTWK